MQLLVILALGVPNVGPFLESVTCIGLSNYLALQLSLTSIIKTVVFIHEGFEVASKGIPQNKCVGERIFSSSVYLADVEMRRVW